jgi:hypothetical protein
MTTVDARPDYSMISTRDRLQASASKALCTFRPCLVGLVVRLTQRPDYIHAYMQPHAVVVDGSSTEERYFSTAMRDEAAILGIPLIELPGDEPQSVNWMTKLDSFALSGTISPRRRVEP